LIDFLFILPSPVSSRQGNHRFATRSTLKFKIDLVEDRSKTIHHRLNNLCLEMAILPILTFRFMVRFKIFDYIYQFISYSKIIKFLI